MSALPPPAEPAELQALRAELARLQQKLELSEQARAALLAQSEHLLEVIAWSRREIAALREAAGS